MLSSPTEPKTPEPDLTMFGYAPGFYHFHCVDCPAGTDNMGDKRASRCKEHALQLLATRTIAEQAGGRDERVTNLIRYNSEQVIKRRELKAHLDVALEALLNASLQFRFYALEHRKKGTAEADAKAKVNDDMAHTLEQAIIWEPVPGIMGKP